MILQIHSAVGLVFKGSFWASEPPLALLVPSLLQQCLRFSLSIRSFIQLARGKCNGTEPVAEVTSQVSRVFSKRGRLHMRFSALTRCITSSTDSFLYLH